MADQWSNSLSSQSSFLNETARILLQQLMPAFNCKIEEIAYTCGLIADRSCTVARAPVYCCTLT